MNFTITELNVNIENISKTTVTFMHLIKTKYAYITKHKSDKLTCT